MDIDYHRKNFSLSVLWTIYVKLVRRIAIISIRNILCIFYTFRHCKLLVPFNTGLIEIASLLVELFFHYICHCIPHVLIIVLTIILADYRQDINKYFYIIGKFLHFNCDCILFALLTHIYLNINYFFHIFRNSFTNTSSRLFLHLFISSFSSESISNV